MRVLPQARIKRAQAKDSALAAARAEAAAANNALKTVETGINYYAMRKEYLKLKDIAEASDVAGKVWNTLVPSSWSLRHVAERLTCRVPCCLVPHLGLQHMTCTRWCVLTPQVDWGAQALVFANEAVLGWEAGTVASRCAAQEAAKQAAEFSQLAHKLMRAVYKAK